MLFFSWASLVLGAAIAARIYFIKGFTVSASFEGFFAVAGGLVVAVFLRMIAKIGQLVFDLNVYFHDDLNKFHADTVSRLEGIAEKLEKENQNIIGIVSRLGGMAEKLEESNRDIRRIGQSVQDVQQSVPQIEQSVQQIAQSTQQTNEFLIKMKRHIETQ